MKLKKVVAVFSAIMMACSVQIVANAIGCDECDGYIEDTSETNIVVDLVDEYIDLYPQYKDEILETVCIITSTEDYCFVSSIDMARAYELVQNNLDFLIFSLTDTGIDTQGLSNGVYTADYTVPVVKQSKNYNCGIAAALQALIGDGFLPNTSSNKSATMQQSIEDMIDANHSVSYADHQYASLVEYALDEYSNDSYTLLIVTTYTQSSMMNKMRESLRNGYCPVVYVDDTSYLSYYGSNNSYVHYLTVSTINDLTGMVTVVDPFNSAVISGGSSSFGGTHQVTYDELMGGIGTSNGWVICYEN